MPRGAGRRPPKHFFIGMGGSVVGGLLYHIIDPPWIMYIVEVVLAVTVLLLTIPHSPQTPNLNPIIQLINAQ